MPEGMRGERVQRRRSTWVRASVLAVFVTAAVQLAVTGSASAANFVNCPKLEKRTCVWVETPFRGPRGEFSVGNTSIQTVFALEGGLNEAGMFFEAEAGKTLEEMFGMLGGGYSAAVVLADEGKRPFKEPPLENKEVTSNLENFVEAKGVALTLPVNISIKGPGLAKTCVIGPFTLHLTTGKTEPPKGVEAITGAVGEVEVKEEGKLIVFKNNVLVDNTFAEPAANECGGEAANKEVNVLFGLPRTAGQSVAIFKETFQLKK